MCQSEREKTASSKFTVISSNSLQNAILHNYIGSQRLCARFSFYFVCNDSILVDFPLGSTSLTPGNKPNTPNNFGHYIHTKIYHLWAYVLQHNDY